MNSEQVHMQWQRPDLFDGRELPRQKDLIDLCKPNGERYGLMDVDNYPVLAVSRFIYLYQESFETSVTINNVPPSIGIILAKGKGGLDWITHDHRIPINDGCLWAVNLFRPNDGHSVHFHPNTDLLMLHTFVKREAVFEKAELYPDFLETLGRRENGFEEDFSIDLKDRLDAPVYQNALAAIFSQPILGNTSEEYVLDNFMTLMTVFSPKIRPVSLEKIDYEGNLRHKILQVRDIIESDIKSPMSLSKLALAVGTNENYLKAGFKHEFGVTVFGYLFECRMQQARKLLRESDLSIYDIALSVGYTDPLNFYRAFRRRFGITPAKFRQGNNPNQI